MSERDRAISWVINRSRWLIEEFAKQDTVLIRKAEYSSDIEEELMSFLFKLTDISVVKKTSEGIEVTKKY